MLFVFDDVVANKDDKSNPVLLISKSNKPDKSKFIELVVSDDVAVPDFTSTIIRLTLSKLERIAELSLAFFIANSASVSANNVVI